MGSLPHVAKDCSACFEKMEACKKKHSDLEVCLERGEDVKAYGHQYTACIHEHPECISCTKNLFDLNPMGDVLGVAETLETLDDIRIQKTKSKNSKFT